MRYCRRHGNQRRGYSLVEAMMGLFCISLMMVAIFSVASFLRSAAIVSRGSAILEAYSVSVAETIDQDMRDGIDISDVNYNEDARIQNDSISADVQIDWQDGVFGKRLYQVQVICREKTTNRTLTVRFFLREQSQAVSDNPVVSAG